MRKITNVLWLLGGLLASPAFAANYLSLAIMQGNTPLLERMVTSDNVNQAEDGTTPLNFAVALNRPEIVKLLVTKQADLNLANPGDGLFPLENALLLAGPEVRSLLLEGGANVNQQSKHGYFLLQLAIAVGNTDLAKSLIDRGANVNAVGNQKVTPIIMAAARNNLTVARWLVAKGAQLNVEDALGNSPLSSAAADNLELIKFLTDKGADPAYVNAAGRSVAAQRDFLAELQRQAAPAAK